MPNRILKESICYSDNLNELSPAEEVFFYRLLVNCDDYGRTDARLSVLRSRCFPLRLESVKDKDIKGWLGGLIEHELVQTYSVNGGAYLQVTTWERHQQIRAKRSKFPAPSEGNGGDVQSSAINGNQVQSDVTRARARALLESESNPNPNPNPNLILSLWNEQKIIVHNRLTPETERAIEKAVKNSNIEDVCQAIKNYGEIVGHPDLYWFEYKWTLKDFLNRGLDKFSDSEVARSNYRKDKQDSKPRAATTDYEDMTGKGPD